MSENEERVQAWHFIRKTRSLGYDMFMRKVEPGQEITIAPHKRPSIKPCVYGLHASLKLVDAMIYAPGPVLCRVEMGDFLIVGDPSDKIVSDRRKVLWLVDLETYFFRKALEYVKEAIDWNPQRYAEIPDCFRMAIEAFEIVAKRDDFEESIKKYQHYWSNRGNLATELVFLMRMEVKMNNYFYSNQHPAGHPYYHLLCAINSAVKLDNKAVGVIQEVLSHLTNYFQLGSIWKNTRLDEMEAEVANLSYIEREKVEV